LALFTAALFPRSAIQAKPRVGNLTTKMIDPPFARGRPPASGERRGLVGSAIGAARPISYIIARGRPAKRDRGRPHFFW